MEKGIIDTVIFDLGGVLIDWNPVYLYKQLFKKEEEMTYFLANICTSDWNEEQDAGRTIKEATDLLVAKYPEHKENIKAFYGRWEEMLKGPIQESVEVLKKIKSMDYKLFALTNWSDETFSIALKRFEFLDWFEGIVVSGKEKSRKPFPEFYQILFDRYSVDLSKTVFIDDNYRNIEAAKKLGLNVIHFQNSEQMKAELITMGIEV